MSTNIDYKVDILIFGCAGLPADWVYNGKYMAGEFTANTFGVTAVRGGGKNILIDCGSNMADPAKQFVYFDIYQARETMGTVESALALIDLKPEDITDIVLTHTHMDHMGAVELFPNAQFYIQKDELEAWEGIAADPKMAPMLMPGVADAGDLQRARALVEEGRMTLLEGDVMDLLPGIDVYVMPNCHSVREQVVIVNTPEKSFVDVGDIVTREAHILGLPGIAEHYMWQSGSAGCEYLTMKAYPWIMEMAGGDIKNVIMRHDFTYRESKTPEAQEGNCIRYKLR